ncbi:MAG: hypothetical protein WCX65_13705 [bacterium]
MSENEMKQNGIAPAGWKSLLFVALLTAGFLWLHSGTLDLTHFWVEEIQVAEAARAGSVAHALSYSIAERPAGLVYNIAAAVAVKIAGPYEPVMRFPALIFGALCIPLFFALLRRFAPNGLAALATFFLFISPPFIFMSMNAGGQTLFMLLALLISLAALRPGSRRGALSIAALAALFAVSLYADIRLLTVIVLGGAIDIVASVGWRNIWNEKSFEAVNPKIKRYFIPLAIAVVLYIPGFLLRLNRPELFSAQSFGGAIEVPGTLMRLMLVYVGAAGGFARYNAALAIAGLFPALYGAFSLFGAAKGKFTDKILWAALPALGFFALISGVRGNASLVTIDTPAPLLLAAPFFIAAGGYNYLTATFRRDAASVFSITLFLRIIITGFLLAAAFIIFGFYTVKNFSDVHYQERQNWREAYKEIAAKAQPGDTLIIRTADEIAMEYYLPKSAMKRMNIVKVKRLSQIQRVMKNKRRTWILLRETPAIGDKTQTDVDKIMSIDMDAEIKGGFLGNLRLALIDGVLVRDRARIELAFGPIAINGRAPDSDELLVCPESICSFKIFAPERDKYNFLVNTNSAKIESDLGISICGEGSIIPAGSAKLYVTREIRPGPCEIQLNTNGKRFSLITIDVEKTKPFELIPMGAE